MSVSEVRRAGGGPEILVNSEVSAVSKFTFSLPLPSAQQIPYGFITRCPLSPPPPPPSPASTSSPFRGTSSSQWSGAPAPPRAGRRAGRACPDRGGSGRRGGAYRGARREPVHGGNEPRRARRRTGRDK